MKFEWFIWERNWVEREIEKKEFVALREKLSWERKRVWMIYLSLPYLLLKLGGGDKKKIIVEVMGHMHPKIWQHMHFSQKGKYGSFTWRKTTRKGFGGLNPDFFGQKAKGFGGLNLDFFGQNAFLQICGHVYDGRKGSGLWVPNTTLLKTKKKPKYFF